jgi:hypothetical protein
MGGRGVAAVVAVAVFVGVGLGVRVGGVVAVGVSIAVRVGVDVGGGAVGIASGLASLPMNGRYIVCGSAEVTTIVDSSKPATARAVMLCLAFVCYLRSLGAMAGKQDSRPRVCRPQGAQHALAHTGNQEGGFPAEATCVVKSRFAPTKAASSSSTLSSMTWVSHS